MSELIVTLCISLKRSFAGNLRHLQQPAKSASSSSGCRTAWLTTGTDSFIGLIDEPKVLKYPHIPGDVEVSALLGLEARILQIIGAHKHIIGLEGPTKHGLLLGRAPFGSLESLGKA